MYDHRNRTERPLEETFAEVQQRWHPWRRRYDLFLRRQYDQSAMEPASSSDLVFSQFALVDEGLFAWFFSIVNEAGEEIATIDRAWGGFGREIFTDTGRYTVDFQPVTQSSEMRDTMRHLTIEERALVLGLAVNIDVDYFSRHSHSGGLGGSWWMTSGGWE